ncbi:MAG TPA: hypothetical protein PKV82_15360 [Anaerolineae bacterium]|nr:hypothetical protein [Anaerolineae bacterium]
MDVKLIMYAFSSWQDRLEILLKILDQWQQFRPQKWGMREPLKNTVSLDDYGNMEAVWNERKGMLFQRVAPHIWLSLEQWSNARIPNRLSMGVEVSFFEDMTNIQCFLDFSGALFEWGNMVYGFAVHEKAYEQKNVLSAPVMIDGKLIKVGGNDIRYCLPGIYWANFFSRTYIEWFGQDRFLTAPCYQRLSLPFDGSLLLTAATPLHYHLETVQHQERVLQKHLGEDAFFDRSKPDRPCRSPYHL